MTALLVQMPLQETEMVNSAPRLPLFDFATPPLKVLIIQGVALYRYSSSAILLIFLSLWLTPLLVRGVLRLSANCWIE